MKQILVIGAGFAGLWSALGAARLLDLQGRDDVQISVLAPKAELHVRPRFYEPDVHTMAAPCKRCSTRSTCALSKAPPTASMRAASRWLIVILPGLS